MAVFYYQKDDNVIGPMTGIDLREAAFRGAVRPATLISNNIAGPWFAAGRADGFFDKEGNPLPHPNETLQEIEAIRGEQNGSGSPHAQGEQAAPSPIQPVAAAPSPIQPVAAAPSPIQPVAAAPSPTQPAATQVAAAAPIQPSPTALPSTLPAAMSLPPTLPAAMPPPDPNVLAIDPSLLMAATSDSASGEHFRNESYLNQAQVSIHENQRRHAAQSENKGFVGVKFIAKCVIGVVITIGLVVFGTILVDYFNNMKDWREHAVEKNMQRKAAEFNMRNR
jgi:hypothetical protein